MDEGRDETTVSRPPEESEHLDRSQPVKFAPDQIVAGRYKVLEEIGRGGMGVVYRVEQVFLRKVFALKILGTHLSDISTVRFQKEAQLCRLLEHPNLIRVFDSAVLDDNSPFLLMEFLQGQTLAQLLSSQGALSEKQVLEIFAQVLDGLGYAHARGVVHRDLKPSNIMLNANAGGNYEVKIVDFGIAKIVDMEGLNSMSLTRTGQVLGSPLYMSPEQCLASAVDLRSDLYSVGCAMYQALTGTPPLMGKTALLTMMLHQTQEPASLKEASLGKTYSAEIERFVLKLLAKSPDERYQSASEARHDLLAIQGKRALKVQLHTNGLQEKKRSTPNMVLVFSLSCLMLVIALAYFLTSNMQTKTIIPKVSAYTASADVRSPLTDKPYFARVPICKSSSGAWTLDFPAEEVGKIDLSNYPDHKNPKYSAQGVVSFPKAGPLIFMTDMRYGFKADDFLRFRSDEIAELQLVDEFVTDSALANISAYKSIKSLDLIWCHSLTEKCVPSILKLSSLKNLRVEGDSISAAEIGRIAKAMHLPTVLTDKVSKPHDLVRELFGSEALTSLFIEHNRDLTDADLADIGKLKQLKVLALTGCKNISDAGISKLTKLPNLSCISLLETNITAKSISAFKNFPHHCWLRVDFGKWPYDDRVLFMKEFPHCIVP